MVDLHQLKARARRAAERGRALAAGRVALVVAPLLLLAIVVGEQAGVTLAVGLGLLVTCWGLRWWSRDGWVGASAGLKLGLLPFTAGLCTVVTGDICPPIGSWSGTSILCLATGAVAGVGVTLAASRAQGGHRGSQWFAAVATAGLLASVGCVSLGVGELLAALAGLAVCAVGTWVPVRLAGVR
jgi:hypothetical protein